MESGNLRRALKAKSHLSVENASLRAEIERLRCDVERLRRGLLDVIACDHHNHYDGPTARYVQVARAALDRDSE